MTEDKRNDEERADEMSEESFPGSDAPASFAGPDKGRDDIRPSGEGGSADDEETDEEQ